MNKKVLKILEYEKIVNRLSDFASSDVGKEICHQLLPYDDYKKVKIAQKNTRDAVERVLKFGNISFQGTQNILQSLKRLEASSALSPVELIRIADLLEVTLRVKKYGIESDEDSLSGLFEALSPMESLKHKIRDIILSENEISDDASKELFRIRKEIKSCDKRAQNALNAILNGPLRAYLQESVVTIRDSKYCILVKPENKSKFPGAVLATSSSGSTLFIQPSQVIEIDNEKAELIHKEDEEIKKILFDLSMLCKAEMADLRNNFEILREFDFIFAKALYALDENAIEPIYNNDGILKLVEARHPLLARDRAVPINIEIGDTFSQLIITGPNTGGKTVSLKTAGLFSLMGASGLFVPGKYGTTLCMFDEVYADIGDEQSIEASLSTFSSHMTNIVNILKNATKNSLCLFDEICGGTDPIEGAALGVSILRFLKEKEIRTITTTHYAELKVFALSEPGVCNASLEFDTKTLSPTYRILIGVPGKSNAFYIAQKLGLDEKIIKNAKDSMEEKTLDMETLLGELEKSRVNIDRDRAEIEKYKLESERIKKETLEAKDKLRTKQKELIDNAKLEAQKILDEAKKYADESIRTIRKACKDNNIPLDIEHARDGINRKMKKIRGLGTGLQGQGFGDRAGATTQNNPKDFHIGDLCLVVELDTKGRVLTLPNEKNMIEVQMGLIKTKVNINEVILLEDEGIIVDKQVVKKKNKKSLLKSMEISSEINLLGQTIDEAVMNLEKYIDDAFLAKLGTIRIVHGKGTGALRKGVHEYLKKNKHIKSFRLGEFGEGDMGVTVCEVDL